MNRVKIALFAGAVLGVFCLAAAPATAGQIKASSGVHSARSGGHPNATLWNQPYDGVSQAIVSQAFPDFPSFSTAAFDDFVVGGGGWNVNTITAYGQELVS